MSRLNRLSSRLVVAAVVLVLVSLLLCLRVVLWRPLALVGESPRDGYTRVAGIVHVHTTLSDGGGSPQEVVAAARAAGLAFVAITDHNNLDAKPLEGYRDGVLVLVGCELSTTAGHILALGIPDPVFRFSGDALDGLDDVRHLDGFSFAAHPLNPRQDLRWTGWEVPGSWGLELVNLDTEWRDAHLRLAATAALYALNRRYALLQSLNSGDQMLARWDRMSLRRDVVGIAGADAHSRLPITTTHAVRFPSYEALFSLVRMHVLLRKPLSGEPIRDSQAILEGLKRGRTYIGVDGLAPADRFSFTIEGPSCSGTMGDTLAPTPGLVARAHGCVPRGARIILLRDGRRIAEAVEKLVQPVPGPGVYRVEVRVPGWPMPWIITNPIGVFDPAEQLERLRRSQSSAASPEPATALVLEDFEGSTSFSPGFDSLSAVTAPILDPGAGMDGRGAARLRFRLGVPTTSHPNVFCALVDWTHRDLTGRSGLVFRIRADGEYRIWVQVRDENRASLDEGTEWWFASVRTAPEWKRVVVPFTRLRSINPHSDGVLNLDKVRAIVFVLDRGSVKPGTEGTIWIDRVGVY